MENVNGKVKELSLRLSKLTKPLKLKEKRARFLEIEAKTTDPGFWNDQENARGLMQEMGDIKKEIEEVEKIKEEIEKLSELTSSVPKQDFSQEIKRINKKLEQFKLASFLSGPYDNKNALVALHAGQGGTEAMDWVSMLFRMYLRFCERKGWKTKTLDLTDGEEAGIKSVTFKVEGIHAYGYFKGESGTHRLVRQSPFNADKLRQTSFAGVEVLPELQEIDLPDLGMKDDDLEWQFFRASSQGGQNVQKVSSAVRVKHIPTGITATAQTERFQEQNRKLALNLLRARIWVLEKEKRDKKVREIKGEYKPASWGTQIRSYVLHPYKMVKDLRTKVETKDTEAVLDGKIDEFIEAELKFTKED